MLHPIELPYQTSYLVLLDTQLNESPLPRLAMEQAAGKGEGGLLYAKRDQIYEILKTALAEYKLPCVLFANKELFGILLKWDRQGESSEQQLADCLLHIQEQLYRQEQISFSFGIGNPVEELTNVPATYKEALNALHTGYQSRQTRFIQFYRTKEAVELLKMIPQGALRDFYTETFRNILQLEEGEREELMTTARVFLETQGQIGETAKRLFIHRNTVTYRLNKYEQLTRRNLRDPNNFLQSRLAFLIDELL